MKLNCDRIFSGEASRIMWEEINTAKTKKQLRWALYTVCCKLQEMESRVRALESTGDSDG